MSCPGCTYAPRCGHPLVAPFEGDPPGEMGAAIVSWCAAAIVVLPCGEKSGPREDAPACPGFNGKGSDNESAR